MKHIKSALKQFGPIKNLIVERDRYKKLYEELTLHKTWVPPGHFYSPITSAEEIKRLETELFDTYPQVLPGIDLNTDFQLKVFDRLASLYSEIPFGQNKVKGLRYYFDNDFYPATDGTVLYCMLRYLKPKRVIEIGSGFSSAVMLDTNERFLNKSLKLTFIEPFTERLFSLLKPEDKMQVTIIEKDLQAVDQQVFEQLKAGDILFVDSTHVSKTGSDVNRIFFSILPALAKGVYIHIHDVFYPFEYPKEWVYQGRSWNEAYLVRAFLQYNNEFSIFFFTRYLTHFYPDLFKASMPSCKPTTGGSLWLVKTK